MKDYATSLIATAPSPSNSGTELTVYAGHGERFPDPPFYATVHPANQMPDLDNAEKVQITAVAGDTFTIVRAQGDTTAKSIASGYRISNSLYADDITGLTTVTSVNGNVGIVILDTDDINEGSTNKYVTSAEKTKLSNLSGTNTGDQDLSGLVPKTTTVNGKALSSNITLTQDDVADGTTYKQYSQTEKTKLAGIATGAEVNVNADWSSSSGDSQILNKPTLGTAAAEDTTAFATAAQGTKADSALQSVVAGTNVTIDNTDPQNPVISSSGGGGGGTGDMLAATYDPQTVAGDAFDQDNMTDGTTNKNYTATEKTKLAGIATGATANDTDANLKNRANHTGTQAASTISDFSTAADARITAATGVSVQGYNANTTTLGNSTTGTGSIVRGTSPNITTPTGIVKGDVGLGNVDNTSDANKPVSTDQQVAIDKKSPKTTLFFGNDGMIPPNFTRYSGNPVFTQANQNPAPGAETAPSLYWPYVIKMTDLLDTPIDDYYMYYSTDHDSGDGGIYLATAPSPVGPWTGRGLVYVDTVDGFQTETPSVIWNEDEELFFMYYQNSTVTSAVGSQSTCLATSPDGETWTRVGVVIDPYDANAYPGDGHTGYFRPFRIGKRWYGYHLLGGADKPHFGISYSSDGRTWMIDPLTLSYGSDQVAPRRIEWNHCDPVFWKGRLWLFGMISDFVSGSTAKDARLIAMPLANDLRHTLGSPYVLLYPTVGANEDTDYRGLFLYTENDKLYWYYQCGSNFNVAIAE